jgi:hypothetical protein
MGKGKQMKRRTFLGSLVALPAALKAGLKPVAPVDTAICTLEAREPMIGEIVEFEKDGLKGLYFNIGNGLIERFHVDEDGNQHTERIQT